MWNMGLVRKNLGEVEVAVTLLEDALKLYMTKAAELYAANVGKKNPLFGGAVDSLSRALHKANRPREAFDAICVAVQVQAQMDGIHPTPLYEQLDRAVRLCEVHESGQDEHDDMRESRVDLRRLVDDIETAIVNLQNRKLDEDGNGGILLQKMGHILLSSAASEIKDGKDAAAHALQ